MHHTSTPKKKIKSGGAAYFFASLSCVRMQTEFLKRQPAPFGHLNQRRISMKGRHPCRKTARKLARFDIADFWRSLFARILLVFELFASCGISAHEHALPYGAAITADLPCWPVSGGLNFIGRSGRLCGGFHHGCPRTAQFCLALLIVLPYRLRPPALGLWAKNNSSARASRSGRNAAQPWANLAWPLVFVAPAR